MFPHAIHRRVQATPKEERAKILYINTKKRFVNESCSIVILFVFIEFQRSFPDIVTFLIFDFVLLSEEPIRSIKEVRLCFQVLYTLHAILNISNL